MNANATKRKEKRWSVMVKPTAAIGTSTSTIPVLDQTTWTILNAGASFPSGTSTIKFLGNFVSKVRLNVPYDMFAPLAVVPTEEVIVTAATYETASSSTVLTLLTPLVNAYGANSKMVGGALNTTLVDAAIAGDTELNLTGILGLQPNTYLCIDPGDTQFAEQVFVTGVDGTVVTLKDPIYFDHASSTAIKEVDTTSILWGKDNYYNLTFNTIYGKSPTGSYMRLSFGSETPWVEIDEKTSFQDAKDLAEQKASIYGLANVKVSRVVDLYDVLYPIS